MAYAGIDKALDYGRRAQTKLAEIMHKSEQTVKTAKQTLEVVGAAAAQGGLAGYFGGGSAEYKLMGVPVDLASGVGLHAVAFLAEEQLGAYAEDLHNLADGSLAYYAGRMCVPLGQKMAAPKAPASTAAGTTAPAAIHAGATPGMYLGYSPLSAEEMAALAHGSYAR